MAKHPDDRDLFPGALEIMILKSLRLKPMHGYALVKHIKQVSDNLLQVEEGSLYPALQRMWIKGWVLAKRGTTAGDRRARYYRATELGRKQLSLEVSQFEPVMGAITRVIQTA